LKKKNQTTYFEYEEKGREAESLQVIADGEKALKIEKFSVQGNRVKEWYVHKMALGSSSIE